MKINDSFPFFYKNLTYDNVVHLILFLPFFNDIQNKTKL